MNLSIQNIISNRAINRIINLIITSVLNLLFVILMLYAATFLYSYGLEGKYFLFLIMLILLSTLPVLNFVLNKVDSVISPASYGDLYVKTVDSILNMESFDEIIYKIFNSVIKLLNAGFGHIICYNNATDVIDIKYRDNAQEIFHREKTESDNILLKYIKGPDDIITKPKGDILTDKDTEIINALEKIGADIAVPVYYNNRIFGIIAIGQKKGFLDREIKLLKIIAFKLAILSVNSYYFSEITKRKEVEKEYELTNKIQKQFLPEPSLESGRIIIKAYHDTASSLTREFYDIFVNDASPDDIRISAYRVYGDVKETSIFMPGVQAILQSYARLGFPPEKTLFKLNDLIKERNLLNGNLMIFHSSVRQSGEFICCCSDYPTPFLYQRSSMELIHLTGQGELKYIKIKMGPGDIIITAGKSYFDIISSNILKYSELINKNLSLTLNEIKDTLVKTLNETHAVIIKAKTGEDEDKLLILIAMENLN